MLEHVRNLLQANFVSPGNRFALCFQKINVRTYLPA